jgi:hypothetical protein
MPMVYDLSLATPGDVTTSGTPGTETATWTIKAGVRNVYLKAMQVIGKGSGLATVSGIVHRIVRFATASTAGTAVVPTPADPGMQAAKMVPTSGQTLGSTRTNKVIFGCGAAGPGGWQAPDRNSFGVLEGGSAASIDAVAASNTASLKFEWWAQAEE